MSQNHFQKYTRNALNRIQLQNSEPFYKPKTQYSELCNNFQTAIRCIKVNFFNIAQGQADTQPECEFSCGCVCVCVSVGSATLATVWQEVEGNQEGHFVMCKINQYRYRHRRHRKPLEWEKWKALVYLCVYALTCAYPRSSQLQRQSWVSNRAHASRALITLGYLWTSPQLLDFNNSNSTALHSHETLLPQAGGEGH